MIDEMRWRVAERNFNILPYKTRQRYAKILLSCIRYLSLFQEFEKDL